MAVNDLNDSGILSKGLIEEPTKHHEVKASGRFSNGESKTLEPPEQSKMMKIDGQGEVALDADASDHRALEPVAG